MTKTKLDASTIETLRQRGKASLFFFARGILGFGDLTPHIHKPVCRALEDYEKNPRTLIVFPRTWFKSTIGSIAYPMWRAIRNSNVRVLIVQNSFDNACKKLGSIKQIFEKNELFRAIYPDILPDRRNTTWTGKCLTVKRSGTFPEGTFEAAGTGTSVTSRHYDVLIEDDTVHPEKDAMTGVVQQPTMLEMEKAIGFHRVMHPMLLHPSKSQIVVIGTRWAERDLIGWIMEHSPEYNVVSQAATKNGKAGGEPVWDRFDRDVLKQLERDEGPYMFASLYLNDPTMASNQVFQRDWVTYYQNMPRSGLFYCTSVDPAASLKEDSSDPDYTVVLTTAVSESTGDVYVVHYTRARMNPGEQVNTIFDHNRLYKPMVTKVEAIAYQRTLGYYLRRRQSKSGIQFYVEEVKSLKASKVDRIRGLQPFFADHKIHIRAGMPEIERELMAFPKGAHDDIIDALSMQIGFWNGITAGYNEDKERALRSDPFTGASVLDELQRRVTNEHRYPNDIGLIGERHSGLRQYQHAG